jgi:ATP-dependent DNA helicase RecG
VHTVKAAVFEGVEKEVFQDRREFSGSLLTQLNEAYDFLEMYNKTHAEVKGLYRIDTRDYPEEALREALLNAVVHREYGFSAGTLISLFEDRIEFVSIGGLPEGISLEDIKLGISVPRNKNLADVFYRLKLIEAYGTGIPKILRAYADSSEKPLIQATGNAFKITLPNRNALSFVAERAPAYGFRRRDEDEAPLFTENEEKVMELFTHTPVLVRKDVEAALSISQAMAVRILRGLLDKRAIRCIGGGKNTRYRLIR